MRKQLSSRATPSKAPNAHGTWWLGGLEELPRWGRSKRGIIYLGCFKILLGFASISLLTLGHSMDLVNNDEEMMNEEIDGRTGLVINKGLYRNPNYLYSFTIPAGMVCLSDPPPAPHHGCGIDLSEDPRAYVWADGSYNSLDRVSPDDAMRDNFDSLMKEGTEIVVLKRSSMSLDGLPAERLIVRYKHREDKESTVEDAVIALRHLKDWGNMIYTLGLISTPSRFEEEKVVLESILASWKNEPPPQK